MSHVEEELLAEILLDRELLREVDDPEVLRAHLVPTRGALVLDHSAPGDHGRLDKGALGPVECRSGDRVPRDRNLDDSGRIPKNDERLAANRARTVDPTAQFHVMARVLPLEDVGDLGHGRTESEGDRLP